MSLEYKVGTFRDAGLEARWSKTRKGAPIIELKDPNSHIEFERERWWPCHKYMFKDMNQLGVLKGFRSSVTITCLIGV